MRGFLDKDFSQELEVEVPEYIGKAAMIVPRYHLFTQEAMINMQLIRSIQRLTNELHKTTDK